MAQKKKLTHSISNSFLLNSFHVQFLDQGGFHLCKAALVHSMVAQFGEVVGIALTGQNSFRRV
jgi:hypothetical protein